MRDEWIDRFFGVLLACSIAVAGAACLCSCEDDGAAGSSMVGRVCDGADMGEPAGTVWAYGDQQSVCGTGACLTIAGTVDEATFQYAFCSCRCADVDGNTASDDQSLCECPQNTSCTEILADLEGPPDDVPGSYCVPNCIGSMECVSQWECVPSDNESRPWEWSCQEI
jgi:hypothetical protein